MEDIQGQEVIIQQQKESVKLFKNTKGYNWEIKLLEVDLDRLEQLNNEFIRKFGNME